MDGAPRGRARQSGALGVAEAELVYMTPEVGEALAPGSEVWGCLQLAEVPTLSPGLHFLKA